MKHNTITTSLALAAAGLVLGSTVASAADFQFSDGDLILGFRKTGGANEMVVNAGNFSRYQADVVITDPASYSGGFDSFQVGGFTKSDLTTVFTSLNSLKISVGGGDSIGVDGNIVNTYWVSRPRSTSNPNTVTANPGQASAAGMGQTVSKMLSVGNTAETFSGNVVNNPAGESAVQVTIPTSANIALNRFAASGGTGGGNSITYNNTLGGISTSELTTPAAFDGGSSVVRLDLWERNAVGNSSNPAQWMGYFEFDGAGEMNFFTPVPEPSTFGLLAGFGLLLAGIRHRWTTKNA